VYPGPVRSRGVAVSFALLSAAGCSGESETTVGPDTGASGDTASFDALADSAGGDASAEIGDAAADAGCADGRERDVWVWGSAVVTTPAERSAFFTFADAHAIRTVYVESEAILTGDPTALASFLGDAKSHCMGVELLYGRSAWALTAGHAGAIALAKASVKFAGGPPGSRPLGVHFDVEPYTLPEWGSDQNGTANQYLDLLEALAKELSGSGLRLSVDVPFWYDGRTISRGGSTRPLHELVIDRVDVATLMDYRDHADPPDGMIDNAAAEMTYAGSTKKTVIVGVETLCGLAPSLVSFCEEGGAVMDKALADTRKAYAASPAFGGFAVHHYGSWKSLKP
jgi:hypothetical protein